MLARCCGGGRYLLLSLKISRRRGGGSCPVRIVSVLRLYAHIILPSVVSSDYNSNHSREVHAMNRQLAIGAALVMLALPAAGTGESMKASETVKVESRDGKVRVTLSVDNAGAAPVHVPVALYKDKELFGRAFTITMDKGLEVDYVGPMVKRGPWTAADFIKVAPGKKLSNTIDITRSYDFKPGTHTYMLRYAGKVLTDLRDLDMASTAAPLAPATFTHQSR